MFKNVNIWHSLNVKREEEGKRTLEGETVRKMVRFHVLTAASMKMSSRMLRLVVSEKLTDVSEALTPP
jgi:hypothetical protein